MEQQYAFHIWLIHAASWQFLSAVLRLICQAAPAQTVLVYRNQGTYACHRQ